MQLFSPIKPPVIGHRGACAYAPENTIASFAKAIQLGVQWVEFDVMQAACGEPIVFHDETLERTTNGQGEVHAFSYAFLRTLDAGAWFDLRFSAEKIPSLSQVIAFLNQYSIKANIEIKALPHHEMSLVKRLLCDLHQDLQNHNERFLFSSFSLETLYLLREQGPQLNLGLLLHEWEPKWQLHCQQLNCVTVNVNHEIITHEAVKQIKSMGKLCLCYTVNDHARAIELYDMGVDAVFSDAPDRITV